MAYGGILRAAALAVRHGGERLDLQRRARQQLRPLYRPVPAADQLMRDGAADLAELERDGRDVRQLLLAADPLDGADDVKYNAQLVHITSSSARRA